MEMGRTRVMRTAVWFLAVWLAAAVTAVEAQPPRTTRPTPPAEQNDQAEQEAPAQPPAGQAESSSFREQISGDADNLLVIHDPLPHLEKLLNNESLRAALEDGRLARALQTMNPGMPPLDLPMMWAAIEPNERYVPQEIAFAMPAESVEAIDHLVRAVFLGSLLVSAAEDSDVEGVEEDLPELRRRLADEAQAFRVPRYVLWVRMREAEDITNFMSMLQMQLGFMAPPGVNVVNEQDALGVTITVADLAAEEDVIDGLMEMGVVENEDDETTTRLVEAIRGLTIELWFHQRGDGLRLTLGEPIEGAALQPEGLGELYREAPEEIAFARWDVRPFKEAARGWIELWEEWRERPIGRHAADAAGVSWAELGGALGLSSAARQMEWYGDTGAMRLWADDALRAHVRQEGVEPAPLLAESELMTLVPASSEAVYLTTDQSLADLLVEALLRFEEQLAQAAMFEEWEDDGWEDEEFEDEAEEAGPRTVSDFKGDYREHFSRFRELVIERAPETFEPGLGVIYTTQGKVTRLEAAFKENGQAQTAEATDLPAIEFAMIAKASSGEAGRELFEDMYTTAVESTFRVLEQAREPDAPPLVQDADLGLGVPTRAFTGGWMTELSGETELSLSVEGDMRPHLFVAGDLLVLSTSPRLSKSILAARSDEGGRMELPGDDAARLVTYYVVPGDSLGRMMQHLSEWVKKVPKPLLEASGDTSEDLQEAAEFFGGIGEALAALNRFEWRVTQEEERRDGRMEISLDPAP